MYGTLMQRIKAFLIDYLLIAAYLTLLFILNIFVFPALQTLFTGSLAAAQLAGFFMVTLPVSIYFIISDSVLAGQSVGKKQQRIQVVTEKGEPPSLLRSTARTLLKFLPWELSHFLVYRLVDLGDAAMPVLYYLIGFLLYALVFLYIFTAIFTKKNQSLYDRVANTVVMKK
ncbi:RDD family protein [Thalassobacillus sp. CUG 92003]|uniref:RDD family protein n=1 Tax=Thalassobacillus sp. CUG 92003 TaxID=2736641 RepID=UPI0015E78660|nr:RDD family protein [Thalassobacillus sp. CUG 92003]